MAFVKCPFCLNMHNISALDNYRCPECQNHLPGQYVQIYKDMRPIWQVMVGFSQHGKTTYLAALTLMLEAASNIWSGSYSEYLDKQTQATVARMRQQAKQGDPTAKTDKESQPPLLVKMNSVPDVGSRILIMYDVAGEHYNSMDQVHEAVPYLRQVNTVWFFVSPTDLDATHTLPSLFEVYKEGMNRLNVDLAGRNLLVVYTKADKYRSDLPPEVEAYLESDPYQALTLKSFPLSTVPDFSWSDYTSEMQHISDLLRQYTQDTLRESRFVNMVEDYGMKLNFCVTSALGTEPNPHTGRIDVENTPRYRVLDPFFWALLLNERERQNTFALILDSTIDMQLATNIWKRMSHHGETQIYRAGRSQPLTHPSEITAGADLPEPPPLLGPILEASRDGTRVVAFVNRPCIDIADFRNTSFEYRVLLLTGDSEYLVHWPHVLRSGSDVDAQTVVDTLLSL